MKRNEMDQSIHARPANMTLRQGSTHALHIRQKFLRSSFSHLSCCFRTRSMTAGIAIGCSSGVGWHGRFSSLRFSLAVSRLYRRNSAACLSAFSFSVLGRRTGFSLLRCMDHQSRQFWSRITT